MSTMSYTRNKKRFIALVLAIKVPIFLINDFSSFLFYRRIIEYGFRRLPLPLFIYNILQGTKVFLFSIMFVTHHNLCCFFFLAFHTGFVCKIGVLLQITFPRMSNNCSTINSSRSTTMKGISFLSSCDSVCTLKHSNSVIRYMHSFGRRLIMSVPVTQIVFLN